MRWLACALIAAALGFLAYVLLSTSLCLTEEEVARREDRNNLRQIVRLLLEESSRDGRLPIKNDALDVYGLVKKGHITGANLRLLRSEVTNSGPTGDQLIRGDYTNFPWERYRGDGKLEGQPFPLLWERKPDEEGMIFVGLSDGTAARWTQADLAAALKPR